MKFKKKLALFLGLGVLLLSLTGCSDFQNWELSMRSKIGALPLTVSTYDSNGQKIDQIKAKSVLIFILIKRCHRKIVMALNILA